jgi:hypothetical protein
MVEKGKIRNAILVLIAYNTFLVILAINVGDLWLSFPSLSWLFVNLLILDLFIDHKTIKMFIWSLFPLLILLIILYFMSMIELKSMLSHSLFYLVPFYYIYKRKSIHPLLNLFGSMIWGIYMLIISIIIPNYIWIIIFDFSIAIFFVLISGFISSIFLYFYNDRMELEFD